MRRNDIIIAVLIGASVLFIFVVFTLAFFGLFAEPSLTFGSLGKRVALVEIKGVMGASESTVRQLKRYGQDESVPVIVLRIDTPGGSSAVAQEIYDQIQKVRQDDGKKVVASMGPLAASGGYYVACAADSIMANPVTLTGSIGVQMQLPRTEELFKKIGVDFRVVKSGAYKDIGSPHRSMTEEEKRLLQEVIDDSYEQFVEVIVDGRSLDRQEVLAVADGRLFTGRQAKKLGLVDWLGTYEDAIAMAGRMGGIEGEPRVIRERYRKETLFDILFQMAERLSGSVGKQAALEYMLSP
jgi:protease-4